MHLYIYFSFTLILSFFCTAGVRIVMQRLRIVDSPRSNMRKIHKKKTPLGGGIAIFVSFFLMAAALVSTGTLGKTVSAHMLWILFFAGLVLMIGGTLDDRYTLKPLQQIWFPLVAAAVIAFSGIGPVEVTNPFGGTISLAQSISLFTVANVLVFFWLFGMMFTTKFLDGLDGLVTGVVAIGALMIFFLSRQTQWYQPEVAVLEIVFAGACFGFLVWNWHPAKIFLGEGGSLFTGFMLGVLAIISGGKIMTTLLVIGIPMLDLVRVVIHRLQHKRPIYKGDSEHLHFKLIESGLSQKQAVLLLYAISFLFGMTTLFLQSKEKLVALSFLFILMLLLAVWFQYGDKHRSHKRI